MALNTMITFKQYIQESDEEFDLEKFKTDCKNYLDISGGLMMIMEVLKLEIKIMDLNLIF
jgi:hypothetical protein